MKPTTILQLLVVLLASCAAPSVPMATPDTIDTHAQKMVADLCKSNDPAWQDASTAQWLSEHVGGHEEHWQYVFDRWTYTVGSEEVGFSWNYTPAYKMGFQYPDFGTFSVHTYQNNVTTVNETNAQDLPRLRFTRLELTCP